VNYRELEQRSHDPLGPKRAWPAHGRGDPDDER
jgi:hypothetical protein